MLANDGSKEGPRKESTKHLKVGTKDVEVKKPRTQQEGECERDNNFVTVLTRE